MTPKAWKIAAVPAVVAVTAGGWALGTRYRGPTDAPVGAPRGTRGPVPVEVAAVRSGPIENRREFTGSLEASAEFTVAPKVPGRIERIAVDLGDTVERGQIVVELDDAEFIQAAAEARAAVAVARAEKTAAESTAELAQSTLERATKLVEQGVGTQAELDTARAEHLRAKANIDVAQAELSRATAQLRAAEVRTAYTKVRAEWAGDDPERTVAERLADEGDTVAANAPLLKVVDLDPLIVVVFATERDYADLAPGKQVSLETDAYPGEKFAAAVSRLAPVFQAESRQARVELQADNGSGKLKPGMFVRASVVLDRVERSQLVPEEAIVKRDSETCIFLVTEDRSRVRKVPVTVGIEQGGWVQVRGRGVSGHVVTLGQQTLEDGTAIRIPSPPASSHGGTEGGS